MTATPRLPPVPLLTISHLTVYYGPVLALADVSLSVMGGQIVTVVGGNGAGKTTLLRAISGLERTATGRVIFDERTLLQRKPGQRRVLATHLRSDQIVQLGLLHVPEGRQLFSRLSVGENLRLGAYRRRSGRDIRSDLERILDIFPILRKKFRRPAATLSGGEQQVVAIGRALMGRPRLLLLDEPSIGLSPKLVRDLFRSISEVTRTTNCAVLLVEQNARMALQLASYGYVLATPGHVVVEGAAAKLMDDEMVRKAYLGGLAS